MGDSIKQTAQGNKIHDKERGLQEDRVAFSRRVISRKKTRRNYEQKPGRGGAM